LTCWASRRMAAFLPTASPGVEEGTAAPVFADLFVVDTKDDSWVRGTPVRVRAMPSEGNLQHVRSLLDDQSARLLRRLGLNRASEGVTFVPKDRSSMSLDLPGGEKVQLTLSPHPGLAAPGCPVTAPIEKGSLLGFTLSAQRGNTVTVLHDDRAIPRARGCSVAYRFASGFIKPSGSDTVIAALLAYREVTAAGTQRLRYLAVTSVLPACGTYVITSCFCLY
jgi:predicted secreted protein